MEKVALLVGVSEYEPGLNPLPAAVNDLDAMREVLVHPEIGGFSDINVKVLKNPDRQMVEEAIYTLFSDRQRDDLLLLYFSGHGIKDDTGTLYLATRSTRKSSNGELIIPTAVSSNFIHERMSRSRSKRQVVILDSCYSGAFAEGLSAKDDGMIDIRNQLGGEGRAVLTSSSSIQYSFEQNGERLSLYTRFLIEGIKTGEADIDEDDVISVNELHEYARRKVQEAKPEIKPELYAIREGFKIRLLNVPQGDPRQKYKKEVARCGKRGKLTLVNRSILDAWRVRLGLSSDEAQHLEDEILEPYRQAFQQKLKQYEAVVLEVLERDGTISTDTRQELQSLQKVLELRNEDTVPIEAKVSAYLKTHKENLKTYADFFSDVVRQEYPLSAISHTKLQAKRGELKLSKTDVKSIESQIAKENETYRQNLNRYQQAYLAATQKEYPLSKARHVELRTYQEELGLTDVEVAPIEAKVATQVETYQQKIQQYADAFANATKRKYLLSEETRLQLKQTWKNLGLNEIDVNEIEAPIQQQVETYQKNLNLYEQDFNDIAQKQYPLNKESLKKLKDTQRSLDLEDEDISLIENRITSSIEEHLQKVQQYKQVFEDSIQYEFPVSGESREELKRFQNVLGLTNDETEKIESRIISQSQTNEPKSHSSDENLQSHVVEPVQVQPINSFLITNPTPTDTYRQVSAPNHNQGVKTSNQKQRNAQNNRKIGASQKTKWIGFGGLGAILLVSIFGLILDSQSSQSVSSKLIDEAWELVEEKYIDSSFNELDWEEIRTTYLNQTYSSKDMAYEAINEMLEKLGDPFTFFMDPGEFKKQQADNSGEFTGVGIRLTQDEDNKQISVLTPIDDTPAFEAGIRSGDVIIRIDDQTTEGMNMSDVVNLVRGPVNSKVTLTVLRDEKEINFDLVRAQIESHPVRYAYHPEQDGGVGYIRLTQFSSNAASEMREAIQELELRDVTGYVLDLRSNPGGLFNLSIDISRMWLSDGTIASTVNRKGAGDEYVAINRALTDKPLVVIVDGGSASASEILASALQDNDRAILVGTRTFGKGTIQNHYKLSDDSGVSITIGEYLTPSGKSIDDKGIEPDLTVSLTDEEREVLQKNRDKIATSENDRQYSKAIEVLNDLIRRGQREAEEAGAIVVN